MNETAREVGGCTAAACTRDPTSSWVTALHEIYSQVPRSASAAAAKTAAISEVYVATSITNHAPPLPRFRAGELQGSASSPTCGQPGLAWRRGRSRRPAAGARQGPQSRQARVPPSTESSRLDCGARHARYGRPSYSSARRHSAGYCFVQDCERVRVNHGAALTVLQRRPRGHHANHLLSPCEGIRAESGSETWNARVAEPAWIVDRAKRER